MDKNDVASAVINKLGDVIDDPQVSNNETIVSTKRDEKNSMQSPRSPARFGLASPSPEYRFMPNLGEHSKEVLLEYGFSDEEINNLAIQNIISVR
jgi:crotonobetainyl-CoA:carnitine CoA-transferase CaiB-like acyl-CoA transferase